ncbi:hypothetical protein [Pseudonocardia sp.]|jgi:hypothetical protein|uniref:hypothetical protein n=1 Tax=Pseudonocardia sp. TaxID=60912 RepID=UPI002626F6FF|nr:hypothetical protein [Pseudonocardia sp.]MCW2721190.1 hypothetical protein [Pseudonocardia sp.]MDT7618208.1 hypothetical protein [Pseudonocardiales bacterium]
MKDFVHIAQNDWYDKHGNGSDSPCVSVWNPTGLPNTYLNTLSHDCQKPDTLPDGPPIGNVIISGIQFGGPLDDLEMLFDAVREGVGNMRVQYENMLEAAEDAFMKEEPDRCGTCGELGEWFGGLDGYDHLVHRQSTGTVACPDPQVVEEIKIAREG